MAKLPDLFVSAVTTFDGKALAKGQKQIGGFSKTVKNLAKAFAATFSVTAITAFGKASVKAFAEDEKAAVRLTRTVNNLGLGFENTRITQFIGDLEKTANVADDVLRPAFTSLLTTTGSVEKSQKLLALALDISAGSGEDVATVAADLSNAYVGNTKGLTKYRLGLTKAELAGKGFNEIQGLLNAQFSGQNAARLDTYQGKMDALGIAFGNMQETIGRGLVDAFQILAGENGIEGATSAMEQFGKTSAEVLAGTASYLDQVLDRLSDSKLGGIDVLGMIPIVGGFLGKGGVKDKLAAEGRRVTNVGGTPFGDTIKQAQNAAKDAKARAAAEAAAAKRAKELLALQKKASITEKNKLSLSKAAAEFDTNRISIAAALRATYDKDTRLRLEALMAIEDDDGDKALERIEQLGILTKAKQTEKLNGLKGITETELSGLNATLMAELSKIEATKLARLAAINASGADQASKDAAKLAAIAAADAAEAAAFAKYNDALAKQGGLNDLDFYSKKTQISTLEILRLASIEKTQAAQLVADQIQLAAGLKTIEEITAKRKEAQEADDKAMAEAAALKKAADDKATSDYFDALTKKSEATKAAESALTTAGLAGIASVSTAATSANALAIDGVASVAAAEAAANTQAISGNAALTTAALAGVASVAATEAEQTALALTANANLTTVKLNGIASVAAAEAAANASAIAGVGALAAAIRSIPPYPTYTPPPKATMPGLPFADPDGTFPDIGGGLYIDPGLVNPGGGSTVEITINAGVIASQDELAALVQETIQTLNRNGDPLFTAGIK